MPKSLDPSAKITMVLACDADKPHATQPRIFARTLTINQQRQLMAALRRMKASTEPDQQIEAALDAAEICLTGWQNMNDPKTGKPIPFSREAIGDVLQLDELCEVFDFVAGSATTTPVEKKDCESRP